MGSLLADLLSDILRSNSSKKKCTKTCEELPYYAKQHFFSSSEQQFYNILNAKLDAQRYSVFPKVRLGDFIQVAYQDKSDYGWWARIRSRHVDYLIWDLVNQEIVLAIELDGKSHNSPSAKEVDEFKTEVFDSVGLELARVRVGTDFKSEIDYIISRIRN